jgi:hypothetical protein
MIYLELDRKLNGEKFGKRFSEKFLITFYGKVRQAQYMHV